MTAGFMARALELAREALADGDVPVGAVVVDASGQVIGATGRLGHNAMTRLEDDLYATEQVGTGATAQRFLNRIDEVTGAASRSVALTRDIRGLAPGGSFQLIGIADNSGSDQLVGISVFNGTITVIGRFGY